MWQFALLALLICSVSSQQTHRYSTLFTAQDVKQFLSTAKDVDNSIEWCRETGVSHVYLESYRDGYTADTTTLTYAKQQFENQGFQVSGCVCTTQIGKPSTGWNEVSCYSNKTSQDEIKAIFQNAAKIFNHIIIDDFYFTDCTCNQCNASLTSGTINVAGHTSEFENTTDESCTTDKDGCIYNDMRRALMTDISRYQVLEASKQVNPAVKVTIKYPNWYDSYQDKGYDTQVETEIFDAIWVGTESRDYTDPEFGGIPSYFGFFNMRWLIDVGGSKTGGGWYDSINTDPPTYIEQARATILGGAKESFLFNFGAFQGSGQGADDIKALRANQAELLQVAYQVSSRDIVGVAAYKPTNSHSGCVQDPSAGGNTCNGENHVFDFVGMLGIPIAPVSKFPANSASAFFSVHALKDSSLRSKLTEYIQSGRPVLVSDGLAAVINTTVTLDAPNVFILPVNGDPRTLLSNPPKNLQTIRDTLLKPLGWQFVTPANVSLFPFSDGSWVVENYGAERAHVTLNGAAMDLDGRAWVYHWES